MLIKLTNGMVMQCYDSDNCLYEDDTNSCMGFCLFNPDGTYSDGGEYDYNCFDIEKEKELIMQVIEFATGQKLKYTVLANTSDCAYETFNELLEEEFDSRSELISLLGKFENKLIREKIIEAIKNIKS